MSGSPVCWNMYVEGQPRDDIKKHTFASAILYANTPDVQFWQAFVDQVDESQCTETDIATALFWSASLKWLDGHELPLSHSSLFPMCGRSLTCKAFAVSVCYCCTTRNLFDFSIRTWAYTASGTHVVSAPQIQGAYFQWQLNRDPLHNDHLTITGCHGHAKILFVACLLSRCQREQSVAAAFAVYKHYILTRSHITLNKKSPQNNVHCLSTVLTSVNCR